MLDHVDVVALHGFPLDWNLWPIDEWPQRIAEIEAVVPDKEIWVTEVGVGSFGAEEVQRFGVEPHCGTAAGPRAAGLLVFAVRFAAHVGSDDAPQGGGRLILLSPFLYGTDPEDGTPKLGLDEFPANMRPTWASCSGSTGTITG